MPIESFLNDLLRKDQFEEYVMLINAFNPEAVKHLMCRNTISVFGLPSIDSLQPNA